MAATAVTSAGVDDAGTSVLRRQSVMRDGIGCAKHGRIRLREMPGMSLL